MKILYARGAYGRKTSFADWQDGKDFRIVNGSYFSIRDIQALKDWGYDGIEFLDYDGDVNFAVWFS